MKCVVLTDVTRYCHPNVGNAAQFASRPRSHMSSNSASTGRLRGIFQRGKKFWFRYSFERHQYRVPLDTEDEGEAVAKTLMIRANPLLAGANPLTEELKSYLADKREEGTYTLQSAVTRRAVLKAWLTERGLKKVCEIREDEIKVWLHSLRKREGKLAESTIESYGMMIRAFCAWLVDRKKLRENPALFIKLKVSTPARRRRFCRREQVDKLIRECPSVALKFILFAGCHAGLRKEEIIQARPEWCDLRRNTVQIVASDDWKPKDKDKRTIPLSLAFHDLLAKEMSAKGQLPGPFLLRPEKEHGRARYRYDFRKPFEEYVTSKKFPWLKPQSMRHTFASLLAIAGVPMFKIAQWLGDDMRVVERHYSHRLPQNSDVEQVLDDGEGKSVKEPGINQAFWVS
jgi:integrase